MARSERAETELEAFERLQRTITAFVTAGAADAPSTSKAH